MLDLYTWTTPNGRKVSIMLEEVGLPYKAIPVDLGKLEYRGRTAGGTERHGHSQHLTNNHETAKARNHNPETFRDFAISHFRGSLNLSDWRTP